MSDHHPSNHLSPERAARLLRSKGDELERLYANARTTDDAMVVDLHASVALIAHLLADHLERQDVERFRAGEHVTERKPWGPDSPGYDEMGQ